MERIGLEFHASARLLPPWQEGVRAGSPWVFIRRRLPQPGRVGPCGRLDRGPRRSASRARGRRSFATGTQGVGGARSIAEAAPADEEAPLGAHARGAVAGRRGAGAGEEGRAAGTGDAREGIVALPRLHPQAHLVGSTGLRAARDQAAGVDGERPDAALAEARGERAAGGARVVGARLAFAGAGISRGHGLRAGLGAGGGAGAPCRGGGARGARAARGRGDGSVEDDLAPAGREGGEGER
jgi:hypothetical protein